MNPNDPANRRIALQISAQLPDNVVRFMYADPPAKPGTVVKLVE